MKYTEREANFVGFPITREGVSPIFLLMSLPRHRMERKKPDNQRLHTGAAARKYPEAAEPRGQTAGLWCQGGWGGATAMGPGLPFRRVEKSWE